jgi:hypothetical protein
MRWSAKVALIALVVAAASACGQGAAENRGSEAEPARSHLVDTEEYGPGVEADLYLPDWVAGPVVVMVPGGSW